MITESVVKKLVELVDYGLVKGLGVQEPGKMCVEAAVCAALGLPHSDNPPCVAQSVRTFKIPLNDANWSSNETRANGMKRLAVAQLGTNKNFDENLFVEELVLLSIKWVMKVYKEPIWTKWAEKYLIDVNFRKDYNAANAANAAANAAAYATYAAANAAANAAAYAAANAANAATYAAANAAANAANAAAYAAANAANAAAYAAANAADRDKILSECAEEVVQLLIKLNSEGSKFLYLTEKKE